jgi:quercetin dioxygenase-like cupin family protein
VISGGLVLSYADGPDEVVSGGDLFYWPPHHSVRVTEDAEVILFSPHAAHLAVVDHMAEKLGVER